MEPSDVEENLASNQRSKENKQWDTKSFSHLFSDTNKRNLSLPMDICYHSPRGIGLYRTLLPPPPRCQLQVY
jgi:hypothetical protein